MAAEVLAEALESRFGGIMIGTLPKGLGGVLDDPQLDPFWETASKLQAAVFLHPMFLCGEPRLSDYDLVNAIGRVADTSIAVARLLFSGHLLRFPGMKLVLSHGGAALPLVLGRLARNFTIGKGKYADPRKGFEALYFDSIVFDADALQFLAAKAGAARIMLGSDMPFPIGDMEPRKMVEAAGLAPAERASILGGNAQGVFRIRPDCWCRS
jgi:aminocarboxymuconate-semialdehyde decarboxylase